MKKLYWNAEERVKKFLFGESFPEHELSEVLTGHGKIKTVGMGVVEKSQKFKIGLHQGTVILCKVWGIKNGTH